MAQNIKNKHILGNAWVSGDARVFGNAWVFGDAVVSGNARVSGDALVFGDAVVSGNAWVSGDARVFGDARVSDNAVVSGDAWVSDNAVVSGDAWVYGNAVVSGDAIIEKTSDYITFGPAISSGRFTTAHKDSKIGVRVNCGCFSGSLDEFIKAIETTHKETNKHAYNQYMAFVAVIEVTFLKGEKQ